MNLLLVNFAEFQLPEWLTVGNMVAALISFISLIAALIKLRNAKSDSNKTFKSVADKLTTNINLLGNVKTFVTDIKHAEDTLMLSFEKVINVLEAQHNSNNNLAAFIYECFSLSNLSDENKLKLKVLYDQLFYKTDAKIIEELRTAKASADNILVQKDKLIRELEEKVTAANEKLNTVQSGIRKSRRVSN